MGIQIGGYDFNGMPKQVRHDNKFYINKIC